jgi:hypothetical protein
VFPGATDAWREARRILIASSLLTDTRKTGGVNSGPMQGANVNG